MTYSPSFQRLLAQRRMPTVQKSSPYQFPQYMTNLPAWDMTDYVGYAREGFAGNAIIYEAIMYKVRALSYAPARAFIGSPDAPRLAPPSNALAQLLMRPNMHQSWREFQQQQTMYLNIAGNCYIFLERKPGQTLPVALWSLRPDRVRIIPDKNQLKGFYYLPFGYNWSTIQGVPILPRDIIHVKFPNPDDELEGMGYGLAPLSAAAKVGSVDNMVTTFLYNFFKRGAAGMTALTFEGSLDDNTIARLRNEWQEVYGGYENWDKPIVLDNQGKAQRLTPPFDELGFEIIDSRDEYRLSGVFGVDGMLIGARSAGARNTYANMEAAERGFWQNTFSPELMLFQDEYQYYLQDDGGAYTQFDLSDVPALKADTNLQTQSFARLVGTGVPPYIAAQTVGLHLERYEGDDISWVSVGVVPADNQTLPLPTPNVPGTPDESPETPDTNPTKPTPTPELPEATDQAENPKRLQRAALRLKKKTSAKQTHERVDRIARSWEKDFKKTGKGQFDGERKELLIMVNDFGRKAWARKASIQWQNMHQDLQTFYLAQNENWRSAFAPLYVGVITDQAKGWNTQFGTSFDVPNIEAADWFNHYTLTFAQQINQTTLDTLGELFQQAQMEGWTIEQMQNRMDTLFRQWMNGNVTSEEMDWYTQRLPPYRTELIARTETLRSSNQGSLSLFKDWIPDGRKNWLASFDDRTRLTHIDAGTRYGVGGTVGSIPMDSPFMVGGAMMQCPGDTSAPASETINCRCCLAPDIG